MRNAMSIDLEDWFCVYVLSQTIDRQDWDNTELRVLQSTRRVLDLFDKYNTRATFFVLGYIADKLPDLIRDIDARGHEIATHGYNHQLITRLTPGEFEKDLVESLEALGRCGVGQEILGYRAPSFSVVEETRWALDIMAHHGLQYDSSVFPIGFHPDYGIAGSPLAPYKITDDLWEFPLTVVDVLGRRLPCSGGGYFRLFPYSFTRYCLKKVNRQQRPAVFYLHPWELDPDQPRLDLPWDKKFRQYNNLRKTEKRLDKLLRDFEFTTMREVLSL
ncbi:MAG: DUF3473 domain-containing protein [Planctomycetes bacterium]|nr:DUF3473 domain-containing protein [Planctomycetota bacterium]